MALETPKINDNNDIKTENENILGTKSKKEEYYNISFPVKISNDVFRLNHDLINLRRYFHANPELSWQEFNTAKNIAKYLTALKLPIKTGIAGTGVTSVIHGLHNGPTILLRADMDALPINETNKLSYKSKVKDVMHACGHDGHMAILLTVARILSEPKYMKNIYGSVKFCFQPAEEGGAGAKKMIEEGNILKYDKELKCNPVDQVYGLHVWSYDKVGTALIKHGCLMAGSCTINIEIQGLGGHGAEPKGTCDTILATSALIIQIHSIVSRNISPLDEGVITIGTFESGTKGNIIAENGKLTGTMRWVSDDIFNIFDTRLKQICAGIEISYQVKVNLTYKTATKYPPTINSSKECVNNVINAAKKVIPEGIKTDGGTMAAEDFAFFLNKKPGCFFFVGCKPDDDNAPTTPHHKSIFNMDERCLSIGVQIFVNLIMDILSKPKDIKPPPTIDTNNTNDTNVPKPPTTIDPNVTNPSSNDANNNESTTKKPETDIVGNGIISDNNQPKPE